jgi:hypothetical protein
MVLFHLIHSEKGKRLSGWLISSFVVKSNLQIRHLRMHLPSKPRTLCCMFIIDIDLHEQAMLLF